METHIFNNQKNLLINEEKVKLIAEAVIANEKKQFNEVSIHFVDTQEIIQLHEEYFDDPTPTDCISFPMDDAEEKGYRILGEIFVCPETAIQYAAENNENAEEELTLYIVHGLLHLMGYDDINEEDCQLMRSAEKRHMHLLKNLGLIL